MTEHHTLGPWTWDSRDKLRRITTSEIVLEFHEDPEAWKAGWIRCSNADRRLIAAAPDLLAACQLLLAGRLTSARYAAEAAIAKANGE